MQVIGSNYKYRWNSSLTPHSPYCMHLVMNRSWAGTCPCPEVGDPWIRSERMRMTQACSWKELCSVEQQAPSPMCHTFLGMFPHWLIFCPFCSLFCITRGLPPAGCFLQPSSLASKVGSANGIGGMGEVGVSSLPWILIWQQLVFCMALTLAMWLPWTGVSQMWPWSLGF